MSTWKTCGLVITLLIAAIPPVQHDDPSSVQGPKSGARGAFSAAVEGAISDYKHADYPSAMDKLRSAIASCYGRLRKRILDQMPAAPEGMRVVPVGAGYLMLKSEEAAEAHIAATLRDHGRAEIVHRYEAEDRKQLRHILVRVTPAARPSYLEGFRLVVSRKSETADDAILKRYAPHRAHFSSRDAGLSLYLLIDDRHFINVQAQRVEKSAFLSMFDADFVRRVARILH